MNTVTQTWLPYCGVAPQPPELMERWNFDPALLLVLGIAIAAYGLRSLSGQYSLRQRIAFAAAIGMILLVFISPICALASALFSVRVGHHVILTGLIAPLLVLSFPAGKPMSSPMAFFTVATSVAIFWGWHLPAAYEAALSNDRVYWFMQLTLAISAMAVWLAARSAPAGVGVIVLVLTSLQTGLLGSLLTFANTPLYAPHLFTTEVWGLTSLEDQQLAGVVMWILGAAIYMAAALAIGSSFFARKSAVPTC